MWIGVGIAVSIAVQVYLKKHGNKIKTTKQRVAHLKKVKKEIGQNVVVDAMLKSAIKNDRDEMRRLEDEIEKQFDILLNNN